MSDLAIPERLTNSPSARPRNHGIVRRLVREWEPGESPIQWLVGGPTRSPNGWQRCVLRDLECGSRLDERGQQCLSDTPSLMCRIDVEVGDVRNSVTGDRGTKANDLVAVDRDETYARSQHVLDVIGPEMALTVHGEHAHDCRNVAGRRRPELHTRHPRSSAIIANGTDAHERHR